MSNPKSNQFAALNICHNVPRVLSIFIIALYISFDSSAQIYSLPEIKENFFRERPQTGDQSIRNNSLGSIDDLIPNVIAPNHPDTRLFFKNMLTKALFEIRTEKVVEGATIWQIYNHGFVVKTPSTVFGIDLHDYYSTPEFLNLADLIDVYFISHGHTDHFSSSLMSLMKSLGKPIVGPGEFDRSTIRLYSGDSTVVCNLKVKAHFGLHSVPVRQFEIITPEGLKFLHTGDNQTSETLPTVTGVDVLMLNAWINESGTVSHVEGTRIAINKIKPKVTLPGHIFELGHLPGSAVYYRDVIASDDGSLASEYYVLGWGERYHFDDSSNDAIAPHIVTNLQAAIENDSLFVKWDAPAIADDGEIAAFYRILKDNAADSFLAEQQISYGFDELRTYSFKVYAYDNCGNQSPAFTEVNFAPAPDVNYPPHITRFYPSDYSVPAYAGVHKLFGVSADDFNGDEIAYKWRFNQVRTSGATAPQYQFSAANLDSGQYQLTAIISDQQDSTLKSWLLNYHTVLAIVDNEDSLMYSEYGNWKPSPVLKAYGANSRYCLKSNVGNWAQFTFYPEKKGDYDLYEIVPQTLISVNDVVYSILVNGQPVDSVHINPKETSGEWVKIGRYTLPANADIAVKIINTGSATEGSAIFADAIKFCYLGATDVYAETHTRLPETCFLAQNYPNPFNSMTTIGYTLPQSAQVTISIFSIAGQHIEALVDTHQSAGQHSVVWLPSNVGSGLYFCKLRSGRISTVKKIMLMK
ncbi:T9SS type A sorting domain-containing protein [candidate division KSB1 bacterium]|nr:T9SS type A sorting domain-containing protein [candidate division KSB1 bacterium]